MVYAKLTRQLSRTRNSLLSFASLHIVANYYKPLIAALGFTEKLVHIKSFIFILSILSFSSFANDISEFWAAEPEYLKAVKINVSQLYNENPDLHVIEFSIKRDPTINYATHNNYKQ